MGVYNRCSEWFVNLSLDLRIMLQVFGSCELVPIPVSLVKGVYLGYHLEYVHMWMC